MTQKSGTIMKTSKTSRILSIAQIADFIIALYLFKNYHSNGLEGLGNQVLFGGIFLFLCFLNIIILTTNVIVSVRNKMRPDYVAIILFLLTLFVVFVLGPILQS